MVLLWRRRSTKLPKLPQKESRFPPWMTRSSATTTSFDLLFFFMTGFGFGLIFFFMTDRLFGFPRTLNAHDVLPLMSAI